METIEYLIELDFDEPALQRTPIILNQANYNSVIFKYKIYKGSPEIDYSAYSRVELIFRKGDGTSVIQDSRLPEDNITMNASGISGVLNRHIFDIDDMVKGQVNLYTEDSLSATLHYSFKVISDLVDTTRLSKFYLGAVERLIAEIEANVETSQEATEIIEEAKRLLELLQESMIVGVGDVSTRTVASNVAADVQIDTHKNILDFLFTIPQGKRGKQGVRGIQGIPGPQGIQGIQGPQGEKGNTGGVTAPISSFFTMYVDEAGDLYVVTAEGGESPMRFDEETGDLYFTLV